MEVLEQIKEKFQKSASNSEKVLLLTLAPKSWGPRRLAKEFGSSERQTRKAKKFCAIFLNYMQILRFSILQLKFAYQNSRSLDPEIAYSLEPVVRILFVFVSIMKTLI